MANIFNSLQSLLKPDLAKAAVALGEPAEKITTAASGILPGLLSKILHKGPSASVDAAIEEAGKNDVLPHLGAIFSGKAAGDHPTASGAKLVHALLGDHTDDFVTAWAKNSSIGRENAGKLTALIGTAVAAFLGHANLKGSALIDALGQEKEGFLHAIPQRMKDIPLSMPQHRARAQKPQVDVQKPSASPHLQQPEKERKKGGLGWLWWLLGLLLLLLLILLCCRSCRNKKAAALLSAPVVTAVVPAVPASPTVPAAPCSTDIVLPNGVTLTQVPCNGVERKMVDFLNSDIYKNGTDAEMKNHWFEFEDVDFVRDSASEFMNAAVADTRLSNIAAIFAAYPAANIRVGGYADKSGNTEYNMEISRERAVWIDHLLDRKGVSTHRVTTEGFGDEQAVFPATASAVEAASDRDIAFRFTK